MVLQSLPSLLSQNSYPGRGIVLGRSSTGHQGLIAYFIMGRSENSRNRVFTEKDGGIITEAADPAKLTDPSLIIYAPVRKHGAHTIVTNGDQTDTIYSCLERGIGFNEALRTRTFEPDAPNFTPRISGLIAADFSGFTYALSILKSGMGTPSSTQRQFFEYPQPLSGQGHFIHTYQADGDPLPSFCGEPVPILLDAPLSTQGELDSFTQILWNSLNPENRVSLFVRSLHLDGSELTCIVNRFRKI